MSPLDLLLASLPKRDLGDGREAMVMPLHPGLARLHVGPKGALSYDATY
jgi:hypothetical protein